MKSDHSNAHIIEYLGSFGVVFRLQVMNVAIYFDGKSILMTIEIDDKSS